MKYQNSQTITRELLIENLVKGICQISFTKVKDNTTRIIYCTLNKSFIPTKFEQSVNKILTEKNPDIDLMPIWDAVEGKWKSFKISKSIYFITSDEIIKENKLAHNTSSKWAEQSAIQKNKIMEDFRNRVAELKRQAAEAKNNINGVNEDEDEA